MIWRDTTAMKKITTLCLLGFIILNSSAQDPQSSLPEPSVPGENGYLKGELIFSLDNRPTPECHASTLVETSSGIVAAWFGGTHEKNKDVGIWISHLVEGQWSLPVEVVNGVQDETLRYPSSECPFACQDQRPWKRPPWLQNAWHKMQHVDCGDLT